MTDTDTYESMSSADEIEAADVELEDNSFKIKSNQDNSTVNNLYNTYLKDDTIILRPIYQRNFCWTSAQQELLIDSLINGFPIPSILIAEIADYKYECIDGQHRLHTIKQFIENKLTYKDPHTNNYYYYEDNAANPINFEMKKSKMYLPLPIHMKKDFERRQICIIIIDKSTKLDEYHKRALFQRLQNGTRVSSVHKIKNIDHMITNKLASLSYMNCDDYKKLTEIYNSPTKIRRKYQNNTDQIDTYCFLCILRIIITYNLDTTKCLSIGRHNISLNIIKELKQKKSIIITPENLDKCLLEIKDFINILYETKNKYYEYCIILLFNVYKNYGKIKLLQILANSTNLPKYNKPSLKNIINTSQLNTDYIEAIQ